jgi:hypothetical protein
MKGGGHSMSDVRFSDYFQLPNPGLRSYFDNVRKGSSEEYRTNFGGQNVSTSKVLKDWMPNLESLANQWPSLVSFEKDLASKVGPMSIMKPLAERLTDIDSYYEGILLPSTAVSDEAVSLVAKEFARAGGLYVRDQQKTVDLMKKSTNAGSPYFTKKKAVTRKTVPCDAFQHDKITYQILNAKGMKKFPLNRNQLLHTDGDEWKAAAILGWRGQEGGPKRDDVKQRVVWMFPYAVNIRELQVYQPLIEACQRFNLVPAWVSMEAVDERVTRLMDSKGKDDLIVCTDFSKFDQHFNESLQSAAKTLISGMFKDCLESRLWLDKIFPIKYEIPLAYDYGEIRFGKHGMGSGSGGTNADETLAHRALQYEAALQANQKLNPNSMCLGDDGILSYPGITPEDVMRTYTSHGLDMNEEKQYASKQDCVYLRRWHHVNYRVNGICVGVYSTCRALGRLCEQERYYDSEKWSYKMVALRQLSIIENVKYHPLRDQFAEFCMKRDKYRLGIDIPGFLDNIQQYADEANENMPDFLGYTKSLNKDADQGLANWWIVRYLKKRRHS